MNKHMDESYSRQALALIFTLALLASSGASAQPLAACEYEVTGTTVPPTSGNPTIIDNITGTVISANFFNGSAIDAPYFDGQEYVSVCVSPADSAGKRTAVIATDVGLDNDFIIKGYPEFVVGSKFGNIFETSFRYYNNNGLPEEDRWPVVATGLDQQGFPFEFANLEYISEKREVGLPAFTNKLPQITVTLDVDEINVVGSERDVMLESWFFDTSKNAAIIGSNIATNGPIANTLNNIVGVGHRHYPQLDNTLLEMMVHIGPLSPHDISNSKNNPGQNQLTEIYSGNDFDNDGIDDHFDVDSHAYSGSNDPLAPSPGIYSSGIDSNGDGIDDADLLPVIIGDFAYSIWYGETFLAPIVIFSRETNSSLTNDFNPDTPEMNLTVEGEITLPWNDFLDYAMFEIESELQALNVPWVLGNVNPFPAMRASSGAIGGVEFGVEPQTNNTADEPYNLIVHKYLVDVGGKESGLIRYDNQNPVVSITNPAINGDTITAGNINFSGTAADTGGSGFSSVRLALRDTSLAKWYNFANNSFVGAAGNGAISATLSETDTGSTNWQHSVDLPPGEYSFAVRSIDNAGNASDWISRSFTIATDDSESPVVSITTPAINSNTLAEGNIIFTGTAADTGGSGFSSVRLALRDTSLAKWYNFANNSFVGAAGNGAISATLSETDTGSTNWQRSVDLPPGDYSFAVRSIDNAGNASDWVSRSFTIVAEDSESPVVSITTPAINNDTLAAGNISFSGTAADTGGSGFSSVRLALRDTSLAIWYNFANNSFVGAAGNGAISASLSETDTGSTNWQHSVDLPPGNYSFAVRSIDNAGNASDWTSRSFTVE